MARDSLELRLVGKHIFAMIGSAIQLFLRITPNATILGQTISEVAQERSLTGPRRLCRRGPRRVGTARRTARSRAIVTLPRFRLSGKPPRLLAGVGPLRTWFWYMLTP